ncbi:MAG: hypothetical protein HC936_18310 [Leptolyngbyaceae cyanobacterium SU_3_3]|nr:hypothetical protein [Leptolyngbyaceae cyanobacterium SU_3_3]
MRTQQRLGISILTTSSLILGTAIAFSQSSPATAQSCIPLRVVEGQGETVTRKRISSPGVVPGVVNNWNTDFAVPTGRRFTSYVATITPEKLRALQCCSES